ncbi:uncharacterized protein V6R79_006345 [Siganus canaliculatus]
MADKEVIHHQLGFYFDRESIQAVITSSQFLLPGPLNIPKAAAKSLRYTPPAMFPAMLCQSYECNAMQVMTRLLLEVNIRNLTSDEAIGLHCRQLTVYHRLWITLSFQFDLYSCLFSLLCITTRSVSHQASSPTECDTFSCPLLSAQKPVRFRFPPAVQSLRNTFALTALFIIVSGNFSMTSDSHLTTVAFTAIDFEVQQEVRVIAGHRGAVLQMLKLYAT